MSALNRVFSKSAILQSWDLNKARFHNKTTPGIDLVKRSTFAANIELEAEQISALAKAGKYRFSRLRPFAIPKPNGKVRLINVPTIRDRFVQRLLLDFLITSYGTKWKVPNSFTSMGVDGEGVHETLKAASDKISYTDYVIKADLSAYFDTINRKALKETIRKSVRHRSLHSMLYSVIDCETSVRTTEEKGFLKAAGMVMGKGIRQGMPLSPVFAYLFLADVDRKMSASFCRYVDDLIFIAPSKAEVESKFQQYKGMAEKRGLKMHPLSAKATGKTYLIGPGEYFDFLGMTIERKTDGNSFAIPADSKVRIEKSIEESLSVDPVDKKKQKGWLLATVNKTTNLIRNYRSAYSICRDWDDYEKSLQQQQLHMCRKISTTLSGVEKSGDKFLLLRLFGI